MSVSSRGRIRYAAFLVAVSIFGAAYGSGGPEAYAQSAVRSAIDSGSAAISRAYFDEARQRAAEGDWAGAAPLIAAAQESDATDSDVHYLAALALIQNGAFVGKSLAELDAAIAADRFNYYRPQDAIILRAELLVRSGRYAEALIALQGMTVDSDISWIRCRAFDGLGDTRSFDSEINDALARFPDDVRFPRIFLESLDTTDRPKARTQTEAALGDIILARLSRYAVLDPEMPVLAAPIMGDETAQRDAVLAYRASGGSSSRATLLALEYGIIDQKTASTELFSGRYPVSLADIARSIELAQSDADREAVGDGLDAYTGRLLIKNRNGIMESVALKAGRATSWTRDYDDARGHISYELNMTNEAPTELDVSLPGTDIHVAYSNYPYCALMTFADGTQSRSYRFAPDSLFYAPVRMRRILGEGKGERFVPVYTDAPLPTETACAASALEIAVLFSDGERQITSLDHGIPQRRETWKGGRLYAVLTYQKGRPRIERVDSDGDGRFETERIYRRGSDAVDAVGAVGAGDSGAPGVEWVYIDTKGTGIFDYREQTVFPFRKEWDFDDNGSIDAIQFQQADGSVVREFSTRMDGRFDEIMTFKDGTIVSLTKNGRAAKLIPDANPSLTWIGAKPFDFGSNLPAGEGLISIKKTRVRIVRFGSQVFAEIVP
jgi:hypothetical protein